MTYDLIIIGGGPAGAAGGLYAARKRLKTLLLAGEFGGQSTVSEDIQNWLGTVSVSGADLTRSFKKHLEAYKGDSLELKEGVWVKEIIKSGENFLIKSSGGDFEARAVLITSGSHRKKLSVPRAAEFENKGITYCASCDGPLFAGKDVVVVGGGNAGFETAAQLLSYVKSVILLHDEPAFRAEKITVDKVLSHPNIKAIVNTKVAEIKGEKFVNVLVYENKETGEKKEVAVDGIFVEIGQEPSTEMVKNLVKINDKGQIVTDSKTQRASVPGVWAAGDCTDGLYHQNNIAAGDGVRAIEDLYLWLKAK